jgi:hypothetical protein
LYTPEFKLLAAKGGAQQQGFKYRFGVKKTVLSGFTEIRKN